MRDIHVENNVISVEMLNVSKEGNVPLKRIIATYVSISDVYTIDLYRNRKKYLLVFTYGECHIRFNS